MSQRVICASCGASRPSQRECGSARRASRCLLAQSDPRQGWGKTVLTSHSGSWDLSPAPSWHQNLRDKSWRGQAKAQSHHGAAHCTSVPSRGPEVEPVAADTLPLLQLAQGAIFPLGEGWETWAGAAEKQESRPGAHPPALQLPRCCSLVQRSWLAGGHKWTAWMVSLLGPSLHLLHCGGIVPSCSHPGCFPNVPAQGSDVVASGTWWPLAEPVTISTRKQSMD